VIGNKPARQPHHLDIASRLALEPTARLHPVEIAIELCRKLGDDGLRKAAYRGG